MVLHAGLSGVEQNVSICSTPSFLSVTSCCARILPPSLTVILAFCARVAMLMKVDRSPPAANREERAAGTSRR